MPIYGVVITDDQEFPAQSRISRPRFEWAARGPLTIRHKAINLGLGITCFYISDLHLAGSWTERVTSQIISMVSKKRPNLILLGGDLVDRRACLPQLNRFLATLAPLTEHLLVIPGNHDKFVGEALVRQAVLDQGAHWLPDEAYYLPGLIIEAPGSKEPKQRGDTFRILCAHEPSKALAQSPSHYHLILAGHLHGCQWVIWKRRGLLYPGSFFYKWNGPEFQIGSTNILVSRGVNDTFPLRWNCPREVIQCDL